MSGCCTQTRRQGWLIWRVAMNTFKGRFHGVKEATANHPQMEGEGGGSVI